MKALITTVLLAAFADSASGEPVSQRDQLRPQDVETLAVAAGACGGPTAYQFLDEAKSLAVTRRASRVGRRLHVGRRSFSDVE
ncbi:MAG TPA: hypothetical protein VFE03_06610, partial [Caulobacteraceae bacterium]|nr:hypothetical protein [Caulobacteraceae bacterium]